MEERDEKDGRLSGGTGKEKETDKRGGKEERVSPEEMGNKVSHDQPGSLQTLEGMDDPHILSSWMIINR